MRASFHQPGERAGLNPAAKLAKTRHGSVSIAMICPMAVSASAAIHLRCTIQNPAAPTAKTRLVPANALPKAAVKWGLERNNAIGTAAEFMQNGMWSPWGPSPRRCAQTMTSFPPRLILVTDPLLMGPQWEPALLAALQGGARFIQYRNKQAPPRQQVAEFLRAQRLCERFGARLAFGGRADIARAAHAEALHLPQLELPASSARVILGHHTPIGVSVHSFEAGLRAVEEGAGHLLLGSVFPTASHPQAIACGLEELAQLTSTAGVPVYAIGGITPQNAPDCLTAGAAGVAVMRTVWAASDICAATKELLAAVSDDAQ